MTKTAIYARVSSEEQVQGYSLDAQLRACREYVKARGWEIAAEYVEEGKSAATPVLSKRPQFQAMMAAAQRGEFGVIIVHKLDRFSRNLRLLLECFEQLAVANVELVSLSDKTAYRTPSDRLSVHVLASVAEFFSSNLGEEVKKGKRERLLSGLSNGRPPFGYMRINGEDVPDTRPLPNGYTNADGYRLALSLSAQDWSDKGVAAELNARGYRTSASWGTRLFTRRGISELLASRFHLGEIWTGTAWEPGKHAPLADRETWERAIAQRRHRFTNPRGYSTRAAHSVSSLTGILFCGYCGSTIWTAHNPSESSYRTRCSKHEARGGCPQGIVQLRYYEAVLGEWLKRLVVPPEAVEVAMSQMEPPAPDAGAQERARLKGALKRLRQQHVWGDLTDGEYRAESESLRAQLRAIEAPLPNEYDLAALAESLRSVADTWAVATPAERHALAVRVWERVVVRDRDVVEVVPRPEVRALLALCDVHD